MDRVEALIREAAAEAILPRFRRLAAADLTEKTPGEWVTAADHAAEAIITAGLRALLPGSLVVGEEAAAADPGLLARLGEAGPTWLVDPLDGTANFAAGRAPFGVMVALLRAGATVAAWILDPLTGIAARAEAGSGAWLAGERLRMTADAPPLAHLRGRVLTRFLPQPLRAEVERRAAGVGTVVPGFACAAREYTAIARGEADFTLFWRTMPWDHAPGALFIEEAGGRARHLDGGDYSPTDLRPGLLIARNAAIWAAVQAALFPEPRPPAPSR